jgi:putative DNA primase/helicase
MTAANPKRPSPLAAAAAIVDDDSNANGGDFDGISGIVAKIQQQNQSSTTPTASASTPPPTTPPKQRQQPPANTKRFAKTDTGNAERLAYYFGQRFRYVEEWDEFLVWRSTHWQRDPQHVRVEALTKEVIAKIRDEARGFGSTTAEGRALYAWSLESQKRAKRQAMAALSRSELGVAVSHEKLDANAWLLNVKNGVLDLRSGELSPHRPTDLITRVADVRFDRKAKAENFKRFLSRVLPDEETRLFLQRFIGYSLTGDVGERVFVVCYGGGRNGKSVLLRIIQAMLGKYSTTCAPGLLMARKDEAHPADVADLFGARLAVASEVKKGRTFDEEKVKRITGNDMLKARRMRENFWEFLPTHKIILATNHKPRVADATDSFWDRIALIPFDVRIDDGEVDRSLAERLIKEELSGILTWAMEGCLAWQKEGLRIPKAIVDATREYRAAEDVVGGFVGERCLFSTIEFESIATLMAAAQKWCATNERFPFSKKDLGEWLKQHKCIEGRDKACKVRGWKGIRLRTLSEMAPDVQDVLDSNLPLSVGSGVTDPNTRAIGKTASETARTSNAKKGDKIN